MVHLIYNTHDDVSSFSKQQVATTKVEKKKVTTTISQQRSNTSTTSSITPPSMTSAAVLQRQRSARREKRRRELEQRRAKQQQQQQQQQGKVKDEYTPSPKTLGLELVASPVMLAKNTIDDLNGGDDNESSNLIDIPLTNDEEEKDEVQEEEEFIIVNKRKGGGSSNGYISRDGTLTSNVELELICATPEKKCMLIEKGEQVINLQSTEVEESSSTLYDNEYPIDEIERNNSIRRDNTLTSKETRLLSMMNHYEGSSPDLVLDDETYDYSDDGDDISTVINYSSEVNHTSAWYMNVLDSLCECVGQYLPEEDVSDLISCSDDSEWS